MIEEEKKTSREAIRCVVCEDNNCKILKRERRRNKKKQNGPGCP
jgi:hypothetical protein